MTPQRKQNNKVDRTTLNKRKNTQPENTHPKTLLPKPTTSPEISKKKPLSGVGQKKKLNAEDAEEAEKLRVSHVDLKEDVTEKYVELQMDNQSNDSGEQTEESKLQFYQPDVSSPRGRNGATESNEKYFNHLKSHRQSPRRSFSPPFRGVRPPIKKDNEADQKPTTTAFTDNTQGETSNSEF